MFSYWILSIFKITEIEEIDTRAVTKYIREKGAMKCIISANKNIEELINNLKDYPERNGAGTHRLPICRHPPRQFPGKRDCRPVLRT